MTPAHVLQRCSGLHVVCASTPIFCQTWPKLIQTGPRILSASSPVPWCFCRGIGHLATGNLSSLHIDFMHSVPCDICTFSEARHRLLCRRIMRLSAWSLFVQTAPSRKPPKVISHNLHPASPALAMANRKHQMSCSCCQTRKTPIQVKLQPIVTAEQQG